MAAVVSATKDHTTDAKVSDTSLLALAENGCDIGQAGHELGSLINQVGPAMTPAARQ